MPMNQNEGGRSTENENRSAGYGATESTGGEHTDSTGRSDSDFCKSCGHALGESKGLDEFLGRLGISDDMLSNLKGQFENVDIEEYLNTAREYLQDSRSKATTYTRENPAKVAGGVAALAVGAGLIYAAMNRAGAQKLEDGLRQLELKRALDGPMYRLDEVLRELDVTA